MSDKSHCAFFQKIKALRSLPGGKIFFWGLLIPPAILLYYFIFSVILDLDPFGWIPFLNTECVFRRITGLYCPGCGGTRAVRALLSFRFLKSFFYHPLPICLTVLYLFFMIYFIVRKRAPRFRLIYVILPALLVALNFLIRNVLLILGFPTL